MQQIYRGTPLPKYDFNDLTSKFISSLGDYFLSIKVRKYCHIVSSEDEFDYLLFDILGLALTKFFSFYIFLQNTI